MAKQVKKDGIVHLEGTTLLELANEASAVVNQPVDYIHVMVPENSEAQEKMLSNFGSYMQSSCTKNKVVHMYFKCMYRNLAMDIDFFASISSLYDWGNDVVYGVKRGGIL